MTDKKWWMPTGALLKILASMGGWASGSQPDIAPLFFFLYGAVDLIGIKGTAKLILAMRRKSNGTKRTRTKTTQP